MTHTEQQRKYDVEYYRKNHTRIRKYQKDYARSIPGTRRIFQRLLNRAGITAHDWAIAWVSQSGICVGCQKQFDINSNGIRIETINIDHNHTTGEFRGLLCWNCNVILGKVNDHPDTLRRLAAYLEGDFRVSV